MYETKNEGRHKINFTEGQVVKAADRSSIPGPYFDPAIEVRVRRTEEVTARNGPQQTRGFLQRINLICHTAVGDGFPHLKRDNWTANAQVYIESIDIHL